MDRKRRLWRIGFSVLFFLVPVLLSSQKPPLRGKALYEKLRSDRNLVKFEGLRRLDWTADGSHYYLFDKEAKTFKKTDAATGEESPLFEDSMIIAEYNRLTEKSKEALPFRDFSYLENGQKIHFAADHKAFVYDLLTGRMTWYTPEKAITGVRGRRYSEVFSPNAEYMAYTRDFNLYIKDLDGKETALTTDGHTDLRNGFPDWVYPEELGQYDAFWWSPDSTKIAYMQFDQSSVRQYPLVHDITPIPAFELQRYPKAGENNPIIRLFIVDIKSKKTVQVETGLETNVYIFRGRWSNDGTYFTWQRMNRWQNVIELFAADPASGKSKLLLRDEDPCYIDAGLDLVFLEDNARFLWTSERSGWMEIYLYDMEGRLIKQLTKAKLPVGSILGIDEARGWVYFSGSENRGLETHAYRVRLDGTQLTKLTKEPGTHRVSFSPEAKYFVDVFTSFEEPTRVTLYNAAGTPVKEIGRSVISQDFADFDLIPPEHFTFKSADGKYDLDGLLYKPAHFDENELYPLILSVYGGPGAKRIYNRYNLNDGNQALAQLGFIVAAVDHRGVSRRGKAFQNLMYLNLGQIELADHVAAVKFLAQKPYVDGSRVGIYGHSYGGYLTCISMLKEPEVFHVGVAGAPVTDWRNYDTIYTERYMRRPQDNPEGYEKGSCLTYAKNLKGHLALHHGAVDDNVHPGNTIQLVQELLKHNKVFDLMIYPEQQHGIRFPQYRNARVDYFIEHLNPDVR